tara:strand:+ start:594 stop:1466 length:873 start_codon:yes stop_codon:yes gene_type:complete
MNNMKVFILGGNRYVGLKLLKLMQEKSEIDDVFTLSRTKNFYNFKNHFLGNRQDTRLLESLLCKYRPDILIDMICFSKNDIQSILDLKSKGALDSIKHYIVISSFFVYNYFPYKQFKEKKLSIKYLKSPIKEPYTMQKVEMETTLMQSDFFEFSSIVRFPFIFSSDDYTQRFQSFCEQAFSKTKVYFDNNFRFSMISKNSAALGLYELITKKMPQGYVDLANEGCLTQKQIYENISDLGSYKKIITSLDNNIYNVKKDLCISTNKISIRKNLREEINLEANRLFNKVKNT